MLGRGGVEEAGCPVRHLCGVGLWGVTARWLSLGEEGTWAVQSVCPSSLLAAQEVSEAGWACAQATRRCLPVCVTGTLVLSP